MQLCNIFFKLVIIFCRLFWAVSCEDSKRDVNDNKLPVVKSTNTKNESTVSINDNQPPNGKPDNISNEKQIEVSVTTKKAVLDISEIAASFKQFQKMNEKPIIVNPNFAMKCVSGTMMKEKESQYEKENGPHKDAAIDIYMNSLAADAFKNKSFPYPVGAVVIKDKNALSSEELSKDNKGVGGMLKREKGFDPEHGDWEYFYFTDIKSIDKGKMDSCIQCHARASEKDYVFGKWNKPPLNKALDK